MLSFLSDLQQNIKFRSYDLHKFTPGFSMQIEVGPYVLKTAESAQELKAAFTLRHQVFYQAHKNSHSTSLNRLDMDRFDAICDHLIIKEKHTSSIVGTYRLNNSSQAQDFYSSTEFNLQKIIASGSRCVELGRACIDEEHRNGVVIGLLWRGIYNYMVDQKADILFGCSSINAVNPRQSALLFRYFNQMGLVDTIFKTNPHYSFKVPLLEEYMDHSEAPLSIDELLEVKALLPSLLRSYIKFGAKVAGEPAYDHELDCVDFLTVMRIENLSSQISRKFKI